MRFARRIKACGLHLLTVLADGLVKVMNEVSKGFGWRFASGLLAAVWLFLACQALAGDRAMAGDKSTTTADHSKFKALQGPFEKAEDVTAACLKCHTEAGEQIRSEEHTSELQSRPHLVCRLLLEKKKKKDKNAKQS